MTIRVLYTDVDGTLVGPSGDLFLRGDREPTLEAAEAIVAARRAGLEIVPMSGRSRPAMIEIARLIGAETWIGELGAIRSYDRGRTVVTDSGAYEGDGPAFGELALAAEALVARYSNCVEEHTPWNAWREMSYLLRGEVDLAEATTWMSAHGFGWVELVDNGVIPRRYDSLPDIERVHVYPLVPRGVSKRDAVAADRRYRGLDREECAVIGDSAADLTCAAEVSRAFVVANALADDPVLAGALSRVSNVEVTEGSHGQGFADAVRILTADAS